VAVLAVVLFLAVIGLGLVLVGVALYYVQVLRPQLVLREPEPSSKDEHEAETLTAIVEQLNALARLRDQRILTSREFTSKKTELLERI
jgi:hypothetical protein